MSTISVAASSELFNFERHLRPFPLSKPIPLRAGFPPNFPGKILRVRVRAGVEAPSTSGRADESCGSSDLRRRDLLAVGLSAAVLTHALPLCGLASASPASDATVQTVRSAVRSALTPAKCPGVLRLAFHDSGTYDSSSSSGGMNGSVIYELDRPESKGLKRYVKLLGGVRDDLKKKGIDVSWADLIAVGGAEAVTLCGGPVIDLKLGRIDAGKADEAGRMPAETFNADQVIESFRRKGYSVQETVVLLGGHTLGGKGFGDATQFDNTYFKTLLLKPWNNKEDKMAYMIGLPSDQAIADDESAQKWIELYAEDEQRFFADFAVAYLKMVDSGATWQA